MCKIMYFTAKKEIHSFYSLPNFIMEIKWQRIRLVSHGAYMGEKCIQVFDLKETTS